MNERDPLERLATLDRPIEPRGDFAEALLARCLAQLEPTPRRLHRPTRLALLAAALLLVVVGVATATYVAFRATPPSAPPPPPGKAALTVITSGPPPNGVTQIGVVGPTGRLRTVWECPGRVFCGTLTSIAWSPDGKRVAMTLGEIGGTSGYVGLHVIDTQTGHDHHLGVPRIEHEERPQSTAVLQRLVDSAVANLGCALPHEVAWAPDSARIAYVCGDDLVRGTDATTLYVINADGTGRFEVPTDTIRAYWPSWSPDGKRLAFATKPRPRGSAVYVVGAFGSHRKLVARDGSAPTWSPDGTTIAYSATCGIRLVTPGGVDVTPRRGGACAHIGVPGVPSWSPDGSRLAIATKSGIDLVQPDGAGTRHATLDGRPGLYGMNRPAWAPATAVARLLGRRHPSGL